MSNIAPLRRFVVDFTELMSREYREGVLVEEGAVLLASLVHRDDWLPEPFAIPDPSSYRQYLLHCDPLERFSIVSFVWGPGQETPIHNHTVWGLVGVLRGAEVSQGFVRGASDALQPEGPPVRLEPGTVTAVSPSLGDIHLVSNAHADRASISIHVYGCNIGAVKRATFDAAGKSQPFVSGYSAAVVPNLWDRSAEMRAQA